VRAKLLFLRPRKWTPARLANLALWLTSGVGNYQDNPGTLAAGNGNPVKFVTGRAAGVNATASADGTRPTLRLPGLAARGAAWDLSGGKRLDTGSFFGAGYNTAFSLFASIRSPQTWTGIQVALSASSANLYVGGFAGELLVNTGTLTGRYTQLPIAHLGGQDGVLGVIYDGSRLRVRWNGIEGSIPLTGNLTLSGALAIGDLTGGGFGWSQRVGELFAANRAVTASEAARSESYLYGRTGVARATKVVAFDGNSLVRGTGSTNEQGLPPQVCDLLGSAWVAPNLGIPSQTTAQLATDAATRTDPMFAANASAAKRVLVFWEGTNSLFFGASAATAIADLKSYCQARRAAGWYVVTSTVLPRQDVGVPGSFEADRATVNAEIRNGANLGVYWDAVADVAASASLTNPADGVNFAGDKVHLTNTGYGVAAAIVAPVVAAA
jgi:lysophospholipase L1-like esterase